MKKIITILGLFGLMIVQAQVGINQDDPKATLDIKAEKTDGSQVEGLLVPRISKEAAYNMAIATTKPQESNLVYVDNANYTFPAGVTNEQKATVADITDRGYYFWNGSKWVKTVDNNGAEWKDGANFIYANQAKSAGNDVVISDNGRIGIGTQSPSSPLTIQVENSPSTTGAGNDIIFHDFRGNSTNTNDPMTLYFRTSMGTEAAPQNLIPNLYLYSSFITGQVGGNQRGLSRIYSTYKGDGTTLLSDYGVSVSGNNTRDFYIKENKNVGIGTGDPQTKLDVAGQGRFTASGGATLQLTGTDHSYLELYPMGITAGRKAYLGFHTANTKNLSLVNEENGDINLRTKGNLTLTDAGNVGIGTATPTEKLDLAGTARLRSIPIAASTENTSIIVANDTGVLKTKTVTSLIDEVAEWKDGANFIYANQAKSAGNDVVISDNGRIGIGIVTPTENLDLSGTARLRSIPIAASTESTSIVVANDTGVLKTKTAASLINEVAEWKDGANFIYANQAKSAGNDVVISDNGRIGIGTQSPLAPLTIQVENSPSTIGEGNDVIFHDFRGNSTNTNDPMTLYFRTSMGTEAAPQNLIPNLYLYSSFITGQVGGNQRALSHIYSTYKGDGTNALSDYGVSVSGNATKDFYIKENKNVGIGTGDPQTKLDVAGQGRFTASGGATLQLTGTDHSYLELYPMGITAGRKAYLGFHTANTKNLSLVNEENGDINLRTKGNLTLTDAGNVGIGTATPTEKLDLAGTARLRSIPIAASTENTSIIVADDTGVLKTKTAASLLNEVAEWKDGANFIYANQAKSAGNDVVISDNGRIGIGTQSPSSPLTIQVENSPSTKGPGNDIVFHEFRGNSTNTYDPMTLHFKTSMGTKAAPQNLIPNLYLYSTLIAGQVGGSQKTVSRVYSTYKGDGTTLLSDYGISVSGTVIKDFYIKENRNVGIGTGDPQVKLDVAGQGRFTATGGNVLQLAGTDHAYLELYPRGITAGRKAYLGFGFANTKNLSLVNEENGNINLRTKGNLILTDAGNVGIGTTAPAEKLEVNGNIKVQDTGGATLTDNTQCVNPGTISYSGGSFFGCTGTNVWKKLHN